MPTPTCQYPRSTPASDQKHIAASQIGKLSCRLRLGEGDTLIALYAHLDGSGNLSNSYLTLAAFAADDETWKIFESDWKNILASHTPPASYTHMWELVHKEGEFKQERGWTFENTWDLVGKCLMFMSHLDKERFRMFHCTVDLKAWRKLKAETYDLPYPIDLCNQYCSEVILNWYIVKYPEIINPVRSLQYFFDQNERFKGRFESRWNKETKRSRKNRKWCFWDAILSVGTVDMRGFPGLQAADMLAWSVNREMISREGGTDDLVGSKVAWMMKQIIPFYSKTFDEATMRSEFKPLIYKS